MSRKRHPLRVTLYVFPLANRLVVSTSYPIMLDCEGSLPIESYLGCDIYQQWIDRWVPMTYPIMLDCEGASLVRSQGSFPIESHLGLRYSSRIDKQMASISQLIVYYIMYEHSSKEIQLNSVSIHWEEGQAQRQNSNATSPLIEPFFKGASCPCSQ